jgi:hypothetical protein
MNRDESKYTRAESWEMIQREHKRGNGAVFHKRFDRNGNPLASAVEFLPLDQVAQVASMNYAGEQLPIFKRKIDYVLDILGAQTVNEAIRGIVGDPKTTKISALLGREDWKPAYRAKLDELVEMAKHYGGQS